MALSLETQVLPSCERGKEGEDTYKLSELSSVSFTEFEGGTGRKQVAWKLLFFSVSQQQRGVPFLL